MRRSRWITVAVSTGLSVLVAWYLKDHVASWFAGPNIVFLAPQDEPASAAHEPRERVAQPADSESLDPNSAAPESWPYYLPEEAATRIFSLDQSEFVYDPWTYYRHAPFIEKDITPFREHPNKGWMLRTNSLGLREDLELSDKPASIRILVTGDSHVYGACSNEESFCALLEAELAARHAGETVEVLNTGAPGYSFYQYAGALEKFRFFSPDVFVVTVFGGNDFSEIVYLHRRFSGSPPDRVGAHQTKLGARARKAAPEAMGQCFNSVHAFRNFPTNSEISLDVAIGLCDEMKTACERRGTRLVVVFVPDPCSCQWDELPRGIERARSILELTPAEQQVNPDMGDSFVTRLQAGGFDVLDMRPVFANQPQPPYWRGDARTNADLHIDLDGHRLIAESLLSKLEPLLR